MTSNPSTLIRDPRQPFRWGEADTETRLWTLEVMRRTARRRFFEQEPDPQVRAERQRAEREMCRRDRVYWIEQWCWMYDPHASSGPRMHVPAVLWPKQIELHRFMDERWNAPSDRGVGEDWAVRKGRREGVTWQHLFFIAHKMTLGRQLRARLLSSKEDGADDGTEECLFGMLRYCLSRLPAWLNPHIPEKEYSRLYLGCAATDAQVVGESAAAGVSRGLRTGAFLLDEFAHLQNPNLAPKIVASTESVARSRMFVSTPAGPGTEFARMCARLPARQVFQMSYRDDPALPEDFRERKIAGGMDPKLFDQEYAGREVVLSTGLMYKGPKESPSSDQRLDIRAIEYNESTDRWRAVLNTYQLRERGFLHGGWDFGSGPSLLVCFKGLTEPTMNWVLWVDSEHTWDQVGWRKAASDVLEHDQEVYSREPWAGDRRHSHHWGDPSGINRESDQESWETNLQSGGVPLTCLSADHSKRDGQEWMVKQVQALIDAGRLRVHSRCRYLWTCLEGWSRDIPQGQDPDYINRAYIPPRHDHYSHGGWALAYLVAGVLISMSAAHDGSGDLAANLAQSLGGSLGAGGFDRVLGGGFEESIS